MRKAKEQMNRLKERLTNQKGFTLIELMATLAILAMVVLIAVPAVGNILAKAEKGSGEAHVAMIENSAELAAVGGLQPDLLGVALTDELSNPVLDANGNPRTGKQFSVEYLIENGYLNSDMYEKDEPYAEFEDAYKEHGLDPDLADQMMAVAVENLNGTYTLEFVFIDGEDGSVA